MVSVVTAPTWENKNNNDTARWHRVLRSSMVMKYHWKVPGIFHDFESCSKCLHNSQSETGACGRSQRRSNDEDYTILSLLQIFLRSKAPSAHLKSKQRKNILRLNCIELKQFCCFSICITRGLYATLSTQMKMVMDRQTWSGCCDQT